MTRTSKYTTWGLLATLAATVAAPVLADPGSQQKNKNQWRNLGIAGAAVAGYGLLSHDKIATLLGAAGAAYSANRYETDRHHQSQDSSNRYDYRRYHRNDGNGGYYNNNGSYNNNGGQWRNGYNSNNGYNSSNGYDNSQYNNDRHGNERHDNERHDNGKHRGWDKHHGRNNDGDDQD